jgi:hypothetical protein
MRSLILISALAFTAAGCSRPAAPVDSAAFTREIGDRVAGPPQSCITSNQSANLRAIDSQTLAYDEGRTIWVSHLGASCPGIESLTTLIVEPKLGGQYCRGDHVRGLEQGAIIPGATCFVGDWVPYRRQ